MYIYIYIYTIYVYIYIYILISLSIYIYIYDSGRCGSKWFSSCEASVVTSTDGADDDFCSSAHAQFA